MIAPTSSAEFVAAREDVLEVDARAPDPARPLVCLDECTKQLTREVRAQQAAAPGQPACEDYQYERHGVAAIFCAVALHLGWRHLEERERKTRRDDAAFLRALADEHFPKAGRIVLVQDNLNTPSPASLYEAFPPAEAARIKARFEFHCTPKHGSWMNIAEIELSAPGPRLPGPAHPRSPHARAGVARVPARSQSSRQRHPLAVHHRRRPREAHQTIPITSRMTDH